MIEIPGYTLLRRLGQGGMAEVYLAVQQSLGREVALKILSYASARDDVSSERFLREARIAASLHHPHIVPIHDFGVHEGCAYIAMEYEPGGTIAPAPGERLESQAALRVVRDVAGALDYAHGRGVVHRDIKPENILRRDDGAAVLSDFGIARLIQGESVLTTEGTSVGTPLYMSPEQLRGDKLDGRSDLYSLGILFWQLLTGDLPFQGSDSWAIGSQHLNAGIPRLPPGLAHLQGLVDALMAKSADARVQSGAEVIRRVDALLAVSANSATSLETPSQSGHPAATWSRRRVGVAAMLVGLVLVLVLLGWRNYLGRPAATPPTVTATPTPTAVAAAKSIAVLAFEDLSAAHDQEYFSDGIAEELSNRLAQVAGLHVAGRSSSLSFKGKNATIAQIGRALDVAQVLEGSVRKDGDRLRVSVQLSNVADGYQLWSQSYDRKLTDVFAVQEDIAAAVVEALKLKLMSGTGAANVQHHQPPFEVYDLYLLGRQGLVRNDQASFGVALTALRKAVALDPDYADAWSILAMAESFNAEDNPDAQARAEGFRRAMVAAERAVILDPQLGSSFASRGYLRGTNEWNWDGALSDLNKAMSLEPGDARNQLRYGFLLTTLNRLPEARAALEQGTRLDPLFTPVWYWLGRVKVAQGDYAGARQALSRALAIDPQYAAASIQLGYISLLQGDAQSARDVFTKMHAKYGLLMAEYSLGQAAKARQSLDQLVGSEGDLQAYEFAKAYAWMGDNKQALDFLERAIATKSSGILVIANDPLLRGVRNDPRYKQMLVRLKLPSQ